MTTPEEFWPLTGLFRLIGFGLWAADPQRLAARFLAAGWPDEPLWKLSGLFDLTVDQSMQAGVADLEAAMAEARQRPSGDLRLLARREHRDPGEAQARRAVPGGNHSPRYRLRAGRRPQSAQRRLLARFPGLYIPILDISFNGPEPTNTQFDTIVITRQYDGFADFPLYPLNLVADLNALLGVFYVHAYPFDVSLAPDPPTSPPIQSQHGDTSYYFFETPDLPLFGPLRTLGVPESLIDVVEPFFRVLVELGYDRSIKPWEPTPARLIPTLDPATVVTDLVDAIGEGINNAAGPIRLASR